MLKKFCLGLVMALFCMNNAAGVLITDPMDASLDNVLIIDFDSEDKGSYTSLKIENVLFSTSPSRTFRIDNLYSYDDSYNVVRRYLDNKESQISFHLDFSFYEPVQAFGFNWGAVDNTWSLSAFDTAGQILESRIMGPDQSAFFGIQNESISFARLENTDRADWIFIDNFQYILSDSQQPGTGNVPTPEPSTIIYLGLGLGVLLFTIPRLRTKRG